MLRMARRRPGSGQLGTIVLVLGGIFIVVSTYLLVNPEGLPTYFYIGYVVRFMPLVFLGVVALIAPLLALMFALVVMFGGAAVTDLVRPLLPASPFWMLLALSLGAQITRNMHRNKAVPWSEGTILAFLALWAALFEIEKHTLATHGILFPLLAGFALVVALGPLRTWRQIAFVLVAMYVAFALLELQLMPFLIPSWGSGVGILREQFGGMDSSLRQATSLDWLLNMMALLSLGMAVRLKDRTRLVLMAFFILFAASSVLTFSRGAYLGLGAGIVALLLVERRRGSYRGFLWVVVAGAVLVGLVYYSGAWTANSGQRSLAMEISAAQSGGTRRFALLLDGAKEMSQHILIGKGAIGAPAHSTLLDMWNNYGGLYTIGFAVFIYSLFRRSHKLAKALPESASSPWGSAIALGLYSSFAGALANSLLDPTFFTLSFAVVFWTMRGVEIGIWNSGLIVVPRLGRRAYHRTRHLQPGTQVSNRRATVPDQPFS